MNDSINNVRKNIAKLGHSELKLRADNTGLQDLWNEKQRLLQEMNQAKKSAADLAAQPFIDAIDEIDQEYAAILALIVG
jgi:molecular chaperone GrpE (heat shock protein)